jgi:hypothetical protein
MLSGAMRWWEDCLWQHQARGGETKLRVSGDTSEKSGMISGGTKTKTARQTQLEAPWKKEGEGGAETGWVIKGGG